MSSKSAMDARFANREGFRIVKCPESMNPNAESSAEMGERISTVIIEVMMLCGQEVSLTYQ